MNCALQMSEFVKIIRNYKPEATLGELFFQNKSICKTLERPRFFLGKENVKDDIKTAFNESTCIPEGTYLVKWTYSPSFTNNKKNKFKRKGLPFDPIKDAVWTYELFGVSNRDSIRLHSANIINQLKGCIATCIQILNMDPLEDKKVKPELKYFASQSETALQKLEKVLPKEFKLIISS